MAVLDYESGRLTTICSKITDDLTTIVADYKRADRYLIITYAYMNFNYWVICLLHSWECNQNYRSIKEFWGHRWPENLYELLPIQTKTPLIWHLYNLLSEMD